MKPNADKLVLLIEDSDEDFFAVRRVFKKCDYAFQLKRTINAEEALEFLFAGGRNIPTETSYPLPSLILLDLNLPGLDGRDLLKQLKQDERLKEIPVVILSSSSNPSDVKDCYRNGANGYHIKTVGFEKFFNSVRMMINYWFETATIPATVN